MNRSRALALGIVLLATVALAACADVTGGGAAGDPGLAAGMCAQDQPDCVDTPQLNDDEPVAMDETGVAQLRRDAKFYLGRPQGELNELIRVARVDDEQMMLTEDYRVGRITVELDTLEQGEPPIVTSATVELPDGPETFTLKR